MGKEDNKTPVKPAPFVSKRQATKFEREQRLIRIALIACAFVVALIVLIPAYGMWKEAHRGDETVVTINGKTVSAQTYAKIVGFRTAELDAAINNYQSFMESPEAKKPENSAFASLISSQVQQLQAQKMNLEMNVVKYIIDSDLIRAEAAKRGITVTQEEIDNNIIQRFGPPESLPDTTLPSPTEEVTGTATVTPTATPTPEPGKAPIDVAKANLDSVLSSLGFMTQEEYITLIAEPETLSVKLKEAMSAEVPTSAEQVNVRHILVENEEDAKAILEQLKNGGDFAALAKEKSTDTSNNEQGGDLGWFPRGTMAQEFEDAAFQVQPGQLWPEPVQTAYGYHIIQGIGHEDNRPLDEVQLMQAKDNAYIKWLDDQATAATIEYNFGWDQIEWARNWVADRLKEAAKAAAAQPAPTAPPPAPAPTQP